MSSILNAKTARAEIAILAELIRQPVIQTWQAIGPDVLACMNEAYGDDWSKDDDELIMEAVLDANRLRMYGGDDGLAADQLVSEACKKFGWTFVVAELMRIIKL